MNILKYALLSLILFNSIAIAAPVGNTGSPALWDEGLLVKEGRFHFTAALDFDYQKNELPGQIRRFPWTDPGQVTPEQRHYEQIRMSSNSFLCSGIKLGATINESAMVYLLTGVMNTTVDMTYYDKTISYGYSTGSDFESDNEFYYGAGFSVIMHRGTWKKDTPVKVGMDLKYRKLEMEESNLGSAGEYYSSSLDELQMAFVISAETERFYPYFGLRISAMSGRERYINKNIPLILAPARYYDTGYIDYRRDINWFKNTGYVTGMSFYVKDLWLFNVEIRRGDEEGFGLSSTIKF